MAEKTKTKSKEEVECKDKKCPFHSNVSLRGRTFVGKVIANKMQGTVRVEWQRKINVPKYERFEERRSRIIAHVPSCMNIKLDDKVKITECRPLSKTIKFVVVEKLNEETK